MITRQISFDISAHVVRQLGAELVPDEITALLELVKNSYDADASYVNIIIDTTSYFDDSISYFWANKEKYPPRLGYIILEDDGIGMGQYELAGGWFKISFSSKRKMQELSMTSPKKNRVPLGNKGLGRLSTQRLGNRLEIFTHKEDVVTYWDAISSDLASEDLPISEANIDEHQSEHHVAFAWSDFTENKSLKDVKAQWQINRVQNPQLGTKIVISDLVNPEAWSGDNAQLLTQQLSQVISPYEKVRPFDVYLTIDGREIDLSTILESLRDVAVSRWSFDFHENLEVPSTYVLEINGRIKFAKLNLKDEEMALLQSDRGQEFFAYLTNDKNRYSRDDVRYIGEKGVFAEFTTQIPFNLLGGLETIPVSSDKDDSANKSSMRQIANPGTFFGELDEFYFKNVNISDVSDIFSRVREYRETIRSIAGVKIYRDGFAIQPYGMTTKATGSEKTNDWLDFGSSSTSGASFYGIRPNNVAGYVSLSARNNQNLEEKTDRGGFIDSPYSRNFFRLMNEVKSYTDGVLESIRRSYIAYNSVTNTKTTFNNNNFNKQVDQLSKSKKKVQSEVDDISKSGFSFTLSQEGNELVRQGQETPLLLTNEQRKASAILQDAAKQLESAKKLYMQIKNLLQQLEPLEHEAKSIATNIEILETQIQDFSELAGLGLTAEALSHEIHNVADALAERTKNLLDSLQKRQRADAELINYAEFIQSSVSTLRKQLSHLAPSLRYVREQKDDIDLKKFIYELQAFYTDRFRKDKIHFAIENIENFSVSINRGKLTQVFDNLIRNSQYWLAQAKVQEPKLVPSIKITIDKPYVDVEDNGFGVDVSVERQIFNPFVTRKPRNEGRGLGLFIIRELLDSSGCYIILLPDRNEFNRRYKFRIDLSEALNYE